MKISLCAALALLVAWPCVSVVNAQSYPSKPVRIIVPFTAGGASDAIGRILARRLTEQLKQSVLVDNRAGAGGSIGAETAVRSAPDGYTTLLATVSEIAVNRVVYTRLNYDTLRDLAPISMVASTPMVIVMHPSMPVKSVKDLIALAKARPGEINMGSFGNGTFSHLSGELFKSLTGANMTHVPYKAAGPLFSDLASGQVQIMVSSLPGAAGLIKGGNVRALVVSTRQRSDAFPEVPTAIESGVPGYEVVQWFGLFVPVATSKEIAAELYNEIAQAVRTPEVIANFAKHGAIPGTLSQQQFADFVRSEVAKWGKVAKAANIKID